MSLSTVSPFAHACDLSELDYGKVSEGLIRCKVCPRQYVLRTHFENGKRIGIWHNSCPTRFPGGHGPGYWQVEPVSDAPTKEEIVKDRARRLDMLAKAERDRRDAWLEYERLAQQAEDVGESWTPESPVQAPKKAKRHRSRSKTRSARESAPRGQSDDAGDDLGFEEWMPPRWYPAHAYLERP